MNGILTKEGEVILLKTDNGHCYIWINHVRTDVKAGWWKVHFSPLTSVPLTDIVWTLDDKQIRGEKFTIKGICHQLVKPEFLKQSNPKLSLFPKPIKQDKNDKVICLELWKKNKKTL
jgi:hypothetical protein